MLAPEQTAVALTDGSPAGLSGSGFVGLGELGARTKTLCVGLPGFGALPGRTGDEVVDTTEGGGGRCCGIDNGC